MAYIPPKELPSSSNPKAVIIIVIIVIIILMASLFLLYFKRKDVSDYLNERKKQKSVEFAEFPTKLVANPDFMASLAPQWPEPDPDPTEDQSFIQQQRLPSSRRGSKELMNAPSWSSLFNVASEADIASEENYRDSLYRGRYRKE